MDKDISKELEVIKNILAKNRAFILSYGTGNEIVPSGVFVVDDILEIDGKLDLNHALLQLVSVEYDENSIRKNRKETILIPYKNAISLCLDKSYDQNYFYTEPFRSVEDLVELEKLLEDVMSHSEESIHKLSSTYTAKTESFEDIGAKYYTNGKEKGSNYSLAPVNVNYILKEFLTLTNSYEDDKKEDYCKEKKVERLYN